MADNRVFLGAWKKHSQSGTKKGYNETAGKRRIGSDKSHGTQPGDPDKGAELIISCIRIGFAEAMAAILLFLWTLWFSAMKFLLPIEHIDLPFCPKFSGYEVEVAPLYYSWKKRDTAKSKDTELVELINKCHASHKRRYGYRRVKLWLEREKGVCVNHKRVLRVMNKYNLLSVIRRKKLYKFKLNGNLKYANILNRNFHVDIHMEKPKTISDARELTEQFINYYNYNRLQLTGKTPYETRRKWFDTHRNSK